MSKMRKNLFILLLISNVLFLFSDEEPISFINMHLKEVKYNWEMIENLDLGESFEEITFTKSSLTNSGNLSLVRPSASFGIIRTYDDNLNSKLLDLNCNYFIISPHGKYFISMLYNIDLPESKANTYELYNNQGNIIWSLTDTHKLNFININDNGIALYSENENNIFIIYKDKTIIEAGPFYNEESLEQLIPTEFSRMSALSTHGNFVVMATENRIVSSKEYHSFPLGSKIFFYSDKGNLQRSYDIDGSELWSSFYYSDSGKYFVMRNDPYMYLFKDSELILKKDVGRLNYIVFSEDESFAFISSNNGNFIMNPETGDTIKTDFGGEAIAIANSEYPIVACIIVNELYLANYKTGEVMLADSFYPRSDMYRPKLQISGDGQSISLAYKVLFRIYNIGTRKK
jgi:hypothetical protein